MHSIRFDSLSFPHSFSHHQCWSFTVDKWKSVGFESSNRATITATTKKSLHYSGKRGIDTLNMSIILLYLVSYTLKPSFSYYFVSFEQHLGTRTSAVKCVSIARIFPYNRISTAHTHYTLHIHAFAYTYYAPHTKVYAIYACLSYVCLLNAYYCYI